MSREDRGEEGRTIQGWEEQHVKTQSQSAEFKPEIYQLASYRKNPGQHTRVFGFSTASLMLPEQDPVPLEAALYLQSVLNISLGQLP